MPCILSTKSCGAQNCVGAAVTALKRKSERRIAALTFAGCPGSDWVHSYPPAQQGVLGPLFSASFTIGFGVRLILLPAPLVACLTHSAFQRVLGALWLAA